jgi:tetratricopeptide (TPR) repeat protein
LRLLWTCRARLAGERGLDVGALTVAAACDLVTHHARQRGVELDDRPTLRALVDQLDRVPLALELAAGRLGVLSLEEVTQRLSLSLLRRGTEDRHGTLGAAFEWSWDVLGEAEQEALAQLSVFAGGFTIEAAEAVLDMASVLDVLDALVEASWVRPTTANRLGLSRSVQEFARERLVDGDEVDARHAAFYARLGTVGALTGTHGLDASARRAHVSAELDNLRAAADWALKGGNPVAVSLVRAAQFVMELVGPYEEAAELAVAAAGLPGLTPELLGRAERVAARALFRVSRMEEARRRYERATELLADLGDPIWEAAAFGGLGSVLRRQGDLDGARRALTRALALERSAGHRRGEGIMLGNLANLEASCGANDEAEALYSKAIECLRHSGDDTQLALVLGNSGAVHRNRGEYDRALDLYRAGLELYERVGSLRGEGVFLGSMGGVLHDQGRLLEALSHYQRALEVHRQIGNRRFEAIVLRDIGALMTDLGRVEEALQSSQAALTLTTANGDALGRLPVLTNLAGALVKMDRLDEAELMYREAARQAADLDEQACLSLALGNLASLLYTQGRLEETRETLESARAVAASSGQLVSEGWWLTRLAALDMDGGSLDAARRWLDRVAEIVQLTTPPPLLATELAARRGLLAVRRGDADEAGECLARAEEVAPRGHVIADEVLSVLREELAQLRT